MYCHSEVGPSVCERVKRLRDGNRLKSEIIMGMRLWGLRKVILLHHQTICWILLNLVQNSSSDSHTSSNQTCGCLQTNRPVKEDKQSLHKPLLACGFCWMETVESCNRRCWLSYTSLSKEMEVLRTSVGRQEKLTIQSDAIWAWHGTTDFCLDDFNLLNKTSITKAIVLAYFEDFLIVADSKEECVWQNYLFTNVCLRKIFSWWGNFLVAPDQAFA